MFLGIAQFPLIRDFSLIMEDIQQYSNIKAIQDEKGENNIKTTDGEQDVSKITRSLKHSKHSPQLSFDSNFMKQHIQSYRFSVQNYMENVFQCKISGKYGFSNKELFNSKNPYVSTDCQIQFYLKSSFCPLSKQQKIDFMTDLNHEEELYQFLTLACQQCCDQVAGELLFIANDIWLEYVKIQRQELSYQQLIEYSKNLMEQYSIKIANNKSIEYITLENNLFSEHIVKNKKNDYFKQFLETFIVTIFLVASEHFSNPYYAKKIQRECDKHIFFNNSQMADQFDDYSEEEQQSEINFMQQGKKKIK